MRSEKSYNRELISLSIPIITSRIVNLFADIVNGLLIAKLGIVALASYTLGLSTFTTFYLTCISMLFSIGISISRASSTKQNMASVIGGGVLLSSLLACVFIFALWISPDLLLLFQQNSNVIANTVPYFHALMYGVFPTLWGIVLSQYLMGIRKPKVVTWISLFTLPINILIAYFLIFHKGGNIAGAGYANSITAWLRFFIMFGFLYFEENFAILIKESLQFSKKHIASMKYLYKFGWPLAVQYGGEVAILTIATYFVGHLDYRYLAAQQVSSQFRILSMMFPFGIAQASSIMIARELATKNSSQAKINGFLALRFGLILIIISSLLCVIFSNQLIGLYIKNNSLNENIIHMAKIFLYVAAVSQLFDTVKIILGGVLRGYGDTKIPMFLGLIALGGIGLPLGYYLGFHTKFGVVGVIIGLLIGFMASAILLFNRFVTKNQISRSMVLSGS